MKKWTKKAITKEQLKSFSQNYNLDPLTSSILIRRGITEGKDVLFYVERDKRFLHNPFLFSTMEDVVDRILQAQDEGEIVLIFGDRDVDGITSTTILYEQLTSMGIQVEWKLPSGDETYGLSIEAVDEFYKKNGTLLITVDCGIANEKEIAHATELGIDVIVLDHHNPPEKLPQNCIIVDPKLNDSNYPFQEISGAAVAFKTVQALRFAMNSLYKQEICLLCAIPNEDKITFSCLKLQNLVQKDFLEESFVPGTVSIYNTKLFEFLKGQAIYVWGGKETQSLIKKTFGENVEFNFFDVKNIIDKTIPNAKNLTLNDLKTKSKILRYEKSKSSEIQGFYNIFVTWINKCLEKENPENSKKENQDLKLVALAALADIMPLKNENRILVYSGIKSINEGKPRPGLLELLCKLDLLKNPLTSTKLSWNVVPVLNATGRLGQPEIAMELLLNKNPAEREEIAEKIIQLNNKRKELGNEAVKIGMEKAAKSFEIYGKNICVVIDEKINRGVLGILAGKLSSTYNVPSMAITFVDDIAIGSMRSCRNFSLTPFLDKMSDIFLNHGGHDMAAGFSFQKSRLEEFKNRLSNLSQEIELSDSNNEEIKIDAELTKEYLTPSILNTIDFFEPYGQENPEINFLSQNLQILDGILMGKVEPFHLKLILNCGTTKWPAIFFSEGNRLGKEFTQGDFLNIVYQIQRNYFNGKITPQIILTETKKSDF